MQNFVQQTKQAFFFSLGFYMLAIVLKLLDFLYADILISIALLVSLLWVVLTLREIMLSVSLSTTERFMLIIFIIFGNILAGLVYFFFIRKRVLGGQDKY